MVDRLLQFIDYKGISKSSFYKDVGLSNGFLDKIKSIGTDNVVKILKKYTELNPIWLLLGEGEMIKKAENNITNSNLTTSSSIVGNNITGNIGDVNISISSENISKIIELHSELSERLKVSQNQLSQSQMQITTLLEILKNK